MTEKMLQFKGNGFELTLAESLSLLSSSLWGSTVFVSECFCRLCGFRKYLYSSPAEGHRKFLGGLGGGGRGS